MNNQIAVFGAGCFWCVEAVFKELKGVLSVTPGYMGGLTTEPTYKEVCTGTTGHAEVAMVSFDQDIISFKELLEVFFFIHDPTSLNRQGADVGTQYRSVIFYNGVEQLETAEAVITDLNESNAFPTKIVTELSQLGVFYEAEDYHKDYFKHNSSQPYCQAVVRPKLDKFREVFNTHLK
jgi:peptide-methionine (S)-S-oxide reductase